MGKHLVAVFQLHEEHGIGKSFFHDAVDFNGVFFRHISSKKTIPVQSPKVPLMSRESRLSATFRPILQLFSHSYNFFCFFLEIKELFD
jgi:hypothetical protein